MTKRDETIYLGSKYGKLTIKKQYYKKTISAKGNVRNRPYFLCVCECGNVKEIRKDHVLSGKTTSCGCGGGVFQDLTNRKIDRLYVVKRIKNEKGEGVWLCKCDCGNEVIYPTSSLNKNVKSCGCHKKEIKTKHGFSRSRLYKIWQGMKDRCKENGHKDYGLRGIKVCEEWRNSFEPFKNWALDNNYSDDLTIDRIDVNGNYEPSNCRWVSFKIQGNNKRNNTIIEHNGISKTLTEWCDFYGLKVNTVVSRIKNKKNITFEEMFRSVR